MKVRKVIKSIVALGTGLTMLGATVFGAMAADLGAYPSQYIQDGKFNGLMVVGAKASTEDVLGIVDIATSLQFASKTEKAVTGVTTSSLSGDVYQVGSSADILEINEYIGDVKSTITEDELGALATTRIRTQTGSTDEQQYLKFASGAGLSVSYTENKDREVGSFLVATDKAVLYIYEVQFPEGLKSAVYDDSTGSTKISYDDATTSFEHIQDIEDEDLNILGATFNIVDAQIKKGETLKLTLMGGALVDTLKERESKTYEINGKPYEVTILIISDANVGSGSEPKVQIMVNGEVTKSLADGDTDTLDDGTVIGIKAILANEGSEVDGDDIVSFYIGANKITLEDSNYTDNEYDTSASLKIDEATIEDVDINLVADWSGEDFELTSMYFRLKADSKQTGTLYIAEGESLRDMLDEPEGMISPLWDIKYLGLTKPDTSEIKIAPSGDDEYYLEFTNQEGIYYSVPLVDNTDGTWNVGTDQESLIYTEATEGCVGSYAIALEDYFILSSVDDTDKAFTKIMSFDDVEVPSGTTSGKLSFSDISDGSTKTVSFASTIADDTVINATTTLNVGGKSYRVATISTDTTTESAYTVCLDLDNSGELDSANSTIITKYGAELAFVADADDSLNMTLTVPGKYFDETTTAQIMNISIVASGTNGNKVDLDYVADVSGIGLDRKSNKGEDDKMGMTTYGLSVVEGVPSTSDDPDTLSILVPETQVYAQVYVTGGDSTASVSSSGSTVAQYTRIQVGKAVLDSEVSSLTADNIIAIGGPCANTIAAQILGISSAMPACYENFPVKEGQGIIKIVDNGGKVATLVAGYTAADTRKAAEVIANYESYADDLAGKTEVVVSGTQIITTTTE